MAASFWTEDRVSLLRELATTKTGSEIAAQMGTTRNAVLGAAHRLGVKLTSAHGAKRDFSAMGKMSSGRKGKTLPPSHPSHRSRPFATPAFSFSQRVHAVAARLAGASRPVAARIVGASPVTLYKLWENDPSVVAAAQAVLARARADAQVRIDARAQLIEMQKRAAMAHNHRLLVGWSERNRAIVLRKLKGEALSTIGRDYGLTRERCRQILARAIKQGLIAPPGIVLQNDRAAA